MKYLVKKVWNGHVSVRDYIVKRCRQDREDLIIDYNGEEMVIPYKALLNPRQLNPKKIRSKFKGEYTLYDFVWAPEDKSQLDIFKRKN